MSTYYVPGHGSLSPSQVHCSHLLSLSVDWIQGSVELQMSNQPLTLQSNTVKITLKNSLGHLGSTLTWFSRCLNNRFRHNKQS